MKKSVVRSSEISAFPWKTALMLSTEGSKVTVICENDRCVIDRSGKHISPDLLSEPVHEAHLPEEAVQGAILIQS
ncbi:MAG: hypothetical protein ACI4KM_12115 [Oscillospiraceae bacterium]